MPMPPARGVASPELQIPTEGGGLNGVWPGMVRPLRKDGPGIAGEKAPGRCIGMGGVAATRSPGIVPVTSINRDLAVSAALGVGP